MPLQTMEEPSFFRCPYGLPPGPIQRNIDGRRTDRRSVFIARIVVACPADPYGIANVKIGSLSEPLDNLFWVPNHTSRRTHSLMCPLYSYYAVVRHEISPNCEREFPLGEMRHLTDLLVETPRNYSNSVFLDVLTLKQPFTLCEEASRSLSVENAGGHSEVSEALSIHYFVKTFGATDILYEKQIEYFIDYKMVDYIATVMGKRVGVSVTRAMRYPSPDRFTHEDALALLHKKLYGLIVSRNSVTDRHSFFKSVLHVWCQSYRIAMILREVYSSLDITDYGLDVKGTLVLVLTVCESPSVYRNTPM